jgi:hypothetical protein
LLDVRSVAVPAARGTSGAAVRHLVEDPAEVPAADLDLPLSDDTGAMLGFQRVSITGPLVGAIARRSQSCCLDSFLRLARFCGPALALGILAQFVPVPFPRGREAMRLAAWTAGWLVWLLAGPASLLHALS